MKKAAKRKNPLKLGKKTYGSEMTKQEAFTKALEPYFKK